MRSVTTLLFAVAVAIVLAGCASVPLDSPKTQSAAFSDTSDTYFGPPSLEETEGIRSQFERDEFVFESDCEAAA